MKATEAEKQVARALFGEVLEQVPAWRRRARALAFSEPVRFYVVFGVTLPEYEAQLDKLEALGKQINGTDAT